MDVCSVCSKTPPFPVHEPYVHRPWVIYVYIVAQNTLAVSSGTSCSPLKNIREYFNHIALVF